MSFFSIRTKLVFFFTILVGANSLVFLGFTTRSIEKQAFNTIHDKVFNISNLSALSITPSLVFKDSSSANELVNCLMKDSDVAYVVIKDENGNDFASANEYLDLPAGKMPAENNMHRILVPIIHDNRVIGNLHMGVSLVRIKKEVESNAHHIFIFSLILFFTGIAAVLAITIPLTKPLKNISDVANSIASGDLSARARIYSRDEIGEMATTFNHMLDSLDHAYKHMNSQD